MPTCKLCKKRNASEMNEPQYQDLCMTCEGITISVKNMEMVCQAKAPKGKSIVMDWKYVNTPL